MLVVRARLTPEVGTLFLRALEAAGEVLYKESKDAETSYSQRRADAVRLVAESVPMARDGSGAVSPSAARAKRVAERELAGVGPREP
jgi:hypothetical protein